MQRHLRPHVVAPTQRFNPEHNSSHDNITKTLQALTEFTRIESLKLPDTYMLATKTSKIKIIDIRVLQHHTCNIPAASEMNFTNHIAITRDCVTKLIEQHEQVDIKLHKLREEYGKLKLLNKTIYEYIHNPSRGFRSERPLKSPPPAEPDFLLYWKTDNVIRHKLAKLVDPTDGLLTILCKDFDRASTANGGQLPTDNNLAQWFLYIQVFCSQAENEVRNIILTMNKCFEEYLQFNQASKIICDTVWKETTLNPMLSDKWKHNWHENVIERVQTHYIMHECKWIGKNKKWTSCWPPDERELEARKQAPKEWRQQYPMYNKAATWYQGIEVVGEILVKKSSRWVLQWPVPSIRCPLSLNLDAFALGDVHVDMSSMTARSFTVSTLPSYHSHDIEVQSADPVTSKKRKYDSEPEEENVPRKKLHTLDNPALASKSRVGASSATAKPQHSTPVSVKQTSGGHCLSTSTLDAEHERPAMDYLHHALDVSSVWSTAQETTKAMAFNVKSHIQMQELGTDTARVPKILTFEEFSALLAPSETNAILNDPRTPLFSDVDKAHTKHHTEKLQPAAGFRIPKTAPKLKTVAAVSAAVSPAEGEPAVPSSGNISINVLHHSLSSEPSLALKSPASAIDLSTMTSDPPRNGQDAAGSTTIASNSILASTGRKRKIGHTSETPNQAPSKFSKLATGAKQAQHAQTDIVHSMPSNELPDIDMEHRPPRKIRKPRSRKLQCGCYSGLCICPGNKSAATSSLDSVDSGYESFDSPAVSSDNTTDTSDIDSPSADSNLSSPSLVSHPAGSLVEDMAAPLDTPLSRTIEEVEEEEEL